MPSTRHADAADAASQSPRLPFHALAWKKSTGDKPRPIVPIRTGASAAQSTLPKMMTSFSVSQ
jgi:hypothetical protein